MKTKKMLFFILVAASLSFISFKAFPTNKNSNTQPQFNWKTISFPFSDRAVEFVMFDSLNGWALNVYLRKLYRLQNGEWHIFPESENYDHFKLFGFSKNSLWISSFDKKNYRNFLRFFNGQKWENIYTPNTDRIRDLAFLASDNIWGACEWGEIIHFDGQEWQLFRSPKFEHCESLTMINDSLGWMNTEYRNQGTILNWNGKSWKFHQEFINEPIGKIMMVNATTGWIFPNSENTVGMLVKEHQFTKVNFSSLITDTIFVTLENFSNPVFFYPNRTVRQSGQGAYINYENGFGEILFSFGDNKNDNYYWFTSDGSVRCVKSKPVSTNTTSSLLYVIDGVNFTNEYGAAFCDFDNDGDEDIYSVNTAGGNRLQLYGGNLKIGSPLPIHFVEAADRLNILGVNKTEKGENIYDMGVTLADMDNDGDSDVYISCLYGNNQLHKNLNGKWFRDIGAEAGVICGTARSNVGIWGDINNDGDVDLFVTNEDTTNMLFLNDGAGQFKEITQQAGLISERNGKGATFGDIDLDGDLDLVVPYFSLRNRVYRNEGINEQSGKPFFKDVTEQWLPPAPDSLAKSASATLADFDNDGDLDLFIANLIFSNRLYENDGTGKFKDITKEVGLLDSSLSHHGCFFDADNDGDLDLYVTNRGKNIFFENLKGKKFVRDSKIINTEQIAYSTGFACGDADNDGDIDYYLCNNDQKSGYFRNLLNDQNFLKIKLIGTKSNRDAIGAKTFLYTAGHLNEKKYCLGLREINGGYGYGCQNSLTIHYGADINKKYDLKIQFPSGIKIIKKNIKAGQFLVIEEQQGLAKLRSRMKKFALRTIKNNKNQHEFILLLINFIVLLILSFVMVKKKWIIKNFVKYVVGIPILFYVFISAFLYDEKFMLDELLPITILLLSFFVTFFTLKKRITLAAKERIAEELLTISNAFDHGSWATSYLNQLQLFATNLQSKKKISSKIENQLNETIAGFYEQVYEAIKKISQLAKEATIEIGHAQELSRQLLFLSNNLNKIKIDLSIKKEINKLVWNDIFRLIDSIKINIKAIKFSIYKMFTCDAATVIQRAVIRFKEQVKYAVILSSNANKNTLACIKPSELSAIMDNLCDNADRAMTNTSDRKIKIITKTTDHYFLIEFTDCGSGISKTLWDKIFEANYSTKSGKKGGFGLYYSRTVLEKYGGSIEVLKSGKNKGTTFLVELKLL